jgi:hypothetical protein
MTSDCEGCPELQGERRTNARPVLIERCDPIVRSYCGDVVQKWEQFACELRNET